MKFLLNLQWRLGIIMFFIVIPYLVREIQSYAFIFSSGFNLSVFYNPVFTLYSLLILMAFGQAVRFIWKGRGLVFWAFLSCIIVVFRGVQIVRDLVDHSLFSGSDLIYDLMDVLHIAGAFYILIFFKQSWRETPMQKQEASRDRRLGAFVIDAVIVGLLSLVFLNGRSIGLTETLIIKGILLVYFSTFECLFLFTPGKILLNLRVVTDDGEKPKLGQLFMRNFARLIPLEAFTFFGFTGLHDRLSKTVVFRYSRAES